MSDSTAAAREAARDDRTGRFGEQALTDPGAAVIGEAGPPPLTSRLGDWLGNDLVARALVEPDGAIGITEAAAVELLYDLAGGYRDDPTMAGLLLDFDDWDDNRHRLDDQLDNTTSDDGIDHGGWEASDEEAARLCREFAAWLDVKPVLPTMIPTDLAVRDDDGTFARTPGAHTGDGWDEFVDPYDGETTISPADPADVRKASARAAAQADRITQLGMWANQRWDEAQGAFVLVASCDRGEALAQAGWDGCVGQGNCGDGWFELVDLDMLGRTVRIFEAKEPVQ